MKKFLLVLFIAKTLTIHAQKIIGSSEEMQGQENTVGQNDSYYLELDNNQFVYSIGKSNGDEVDLVKSDKNYRTIWSVPRLNKFLWAAKYNNNIIVFSNPDEDKHYRTSSVHATIYSGENGKILNEKVIPTFSAKVFTSFYLLTDSSKNFQYLLMRTTEDDNNKRFMKTQDELNMGYTANLQAISFDEGFNVKTISLNTTLIQKAQFVACTSNGQGDIFVVAIQNNGLMLSEYNAGKSDASTTITGKLNLEHNVMVNYGAFSKASKNLVALSFVLDQEKISDNILVTALFDLGSGKGFTSQELIDRNFVKQYADQFNAGKGEIYPIGIEFYRDKLVVMKECKNPHFTTDKQDIYYVFSPIIIDVYDHNLRKVKELQADENSSTFLESSSAYYKLWNNKLFVFYNQNKNALTFHSKYQSVELDNLSIDKQIDFNPDPKMNALMFGPGIIWLDNVGLFPFIRKQGMLSKKILTTFKTVQF